jgi:hypothetical protein
VSITARRRIRRSLAAGAAPVLVLSLAACSQSVDEASSDYCSGLDTLRAEIASLESLVSSDATLDEIQAQRATVQDAYQATSDSAADLDDAVAEAAESAHDDYQEALDAIPDDAALTEAASQYADAVRGYAVSLATIAADAGCDGSDS